MDILFQETQALSEALSSPAVEDTHREDDESNEVLKAKFVPLYERIAQRAEAGGIRARPDLWPRSRD